MSDSYISGNCFTRALSNLMGAEDHLIFLYRDFVKPDEFYSRAVRKEIINKVFQYAEGKYLWNYNYSEKDFEASIEKEIRYRDKSPLPKGYHQRPATTYKSYVRNEGPKVILGEYPGSVFLTLFSFALSPSNVETLIKGKILVPEKKYDIEIIKTVANYFKDPRGPKKLIATFQFLMDLPDCRALFGKHIEIEWTSQCNDHNYTFSSKVARTREEVFLAQKQTPPYVAKFYAVVLERVLNDHYIYETAHFEKRMVLLDRLQQLPTGTKGKGAVKHELVVINKQNEYEINMEQLKKVHLMVRLMMDTKSGKEFMEAFCDHMQTTFPGRADGNKASKPALLFAEKFFVWAADSLEFEKGLVEPLKSMYTFGAIPPNKKISIRVLHNPAKKLGTHTSFIFKEELIHALRKYENTFGELKIKLPPPIHPGPIPVSATTISTFLCEVELQKLTGNRIVFEPCKLDKLEIPPYGDTVALGPFNRHVVSIQKAFNSILTILVDELRLGIQLLPTHPKVAEFLEKFIASFPIAKFIQFIDIQALMELKNEAYALKEYMQVSYETSTIYDLGALHLELFPIFKQYGFGNEHQRILFRRFTLLKMFPKSGVLMHRMYCNGDLCILSTEPDFLPYFGPPVESMTNAIPTLVCSGQFDKNTEACDLQELLWDQ